VAAENDFSGQRNDTPNTKEIDDIRKYSKDSARTMFPDCEVTKKSFGLRSAAAATVHAGTVKVRGQFS